MESRVSKGLRFLVELLFQPPGPTTKGRKEVSDRRFSRTIGNAKRWDCSVDLNFLAEQFSRFAAVLKAIPPELGHIGAGGFGALANRYWYYKRITNRELRIRLRALVHSAIYIFIGLGIGFFFGMGFNFSYNTIPLSVILGALWPYIVSGTSEAAKVMAAVRHKILLGTSG